MPGIRPIVRYVTTRHFARNASTFWRFSCALEAGGEEFDSAQGRALNKAMEAWPIPPMRRLLVPVLAAAVVVSTLGLAILPRGVASFVEDAWFDVITLNPREIADSYPSLDGSAGVSSTDLAYGLLALSFMALVLLAPLFVLSGSYRVARLILEGAAPVDSPGRAEGWGIGDRWDGPRDNSLASTKLYAESLGVRWTTGLVGEFMAKLLFAITAILGALLFVGTLTLIPEERRQFIRTYQEATGGNPTSFGLRDLLNAASIMFVPLALVIVWGVSSAIATSRDYQEICQAHPPRTHKTLAWRDWLTWAWLLSCLISFFPPFSLLASLMTALASHLASRRRRDQSKARALRVRWWACLLSLGNVVSLILLVS